MYNVIEQVRLKGRQALESVYHDHRDAFVHWARHQYRCNEEEAREIFQQTVVIFYENVMQGKLITVTSSLKTYLFSIGKNKIMELKRYQGKHVSTEGEDFVDHADSGFEYHLEQLAEKSIGQLPEPCRSLLIDFYYHRKTMQQLAERYGYKNEDTAKSQKYRCLLSLRKIFNEIKVKSEA